MAPRVILFHYTLTDSAGNSLDSSAGGEPLAFMEGASEIIPGLESRILGAGAGERKTIHVSAAEAYGQRDDKLVFTVPSEKLPGDNIQIGDRFRGGEGESPIFTVTAVQDGVVTMDANHPLAGKDLVFDVEILEVREATAEEVTHGHAHHGEHHH